MTIQEFYDFCVANSVPLTLHMAVRAKDDYFITPDKLSVGSAYFGNCSDGTDFEQENAPRNEDGDIDYDENPLQYLILDSGNG